MLNKKFVATPKGQFVTAFGACIVLTVVSAVVSNSSEPNYSVTIRLSHARNAGSYVDLSAHKFKELLQEKSDKQVSVNIYPNNGLAAGDQGHVIDMLKSGAIDIQISSATDLYNLDNRFGTFWLPFLFENDDQINYFVNNEEVRSTMQSWLDPHNITLKSMYSAGARQLSNNVKEITSPDDLKGMNFRIPPFEAAKRTFELFGANPVSISFSEVPMALEHKTIQGQESNLALFLSAKLYEHQQYVTLWNGLYDIHVWLANDKAMSQLTAEQRKAVEDSIKETIAWQQNMVEGFNKLYLKTLTAKGVKITSLTPEQMKAFQAKALPIYEKFIEMFGTESLEFVLSHRDSSKGEHSAVMPVEQHAVAAAEETLLAAPELISNVAGDQIEVLPEGAIENAPQLDESLSEAVEIAASQAAAQSAASEDAVAEATPVQEGTEQAVEQELMAEFSIEETTDDKAVEEFNKTETQVAPEATAQAEPVADATVVNATMSIKSDAPASLFAALPGVVDVVSSVQIIDPAAQAAQAAAAAAAKTKTADADPLKSMVATKAVSNSAKSKVAPATPVVENAAPAPVVDAAPAPVIEAVPAPVVEVVPAAPAPVVAPAAVPTGKAASCNGMPNKAAVAPVTEPDAPVVENAAPAAVEAVPAAPAPVVAPAAVPTGKAASCNGMPNKAPAAPVVQPKSAAVEQAKERTVIITEDNPQVKGFSTRYEDVPAVSGFKPIVEDHASVKGFDPVIIDEPSVKGFFPVDTAPAVKGFNKAQGKQPVQTQAPVQHPAMNSVQPVSPLNLQPSLQFVPVGDATIQYIEVAPGQFQAVQVVPVQPVQIQPLNTKTYGNTHYQQVVPTEQLTPATPVEQAPVAAPAEEAVAPAQEQSAPVEDVAVPAEAEVAPADVEGAEDTDDAEDSSYGELPDPIFIVPDVLLNDVPDYLSPEDLVGTTYPAVKH